MKHKLYNRLLSLALALGLVVGMLPGMTFAGAVDTTAPQSQAEQIAEPTEEPEANDAPQAEPRVNTQSFTVQFVDGNGDSIGQSDRRYSLSGTSAVTIQAIADSFGDISGYTFTNEAYIDQGWWDNINNIQQVRYQSRTLMYNDGESWKNWPSSIFSGAYPLVLVYEKNEEPEPTPTPDGDVYITDSILTNGLLNAGVAEKLQEQVASYKWYRSETGTEGTWKEVERNRVTGTEYNVNTDGTGLNAALDKYFAEPDDDTVRFYYYVEAFDANGSSLGKSDAYQVPYYDALQNGSFETPVADHWNNQLPNGTENLYWLTTAPNGEGQDVEIVRSTAERFNDSGQRKTYQKKVQEIYGPTSADEGDQFAELNAEAQGALYQDVLTTPGSTLYWSLAHAARQDSKPDSMKVIIAPADKVQNITTQQRLLDFIRQHPEYVQKPAGSSDDGTIKSNTSNWTTYNGTYQVADGQYVTRFFFVSLDGDTLGNLLDDISFSRNIPEPDEGTGNLTVTKQVVGMDEIPDDYEVVIKVKDGYDTQRQTTLTKSNFQWNPDDQVWKASYVFQNLPVGTNDTRYYSVTEEVSGYSEDEFEFQKRESIISKNVQVQAGKTVSAELKNVYLQDTSDEYPVRFYLEGIEKGKAEDYPFEDAWATLSAYLSGGFANVTTTLHSASNYPNLDNESGFVSGSYGGQIDGAIVGDSNVQSWLEKYKCEPTLNMSDIKTVLEYLVDLYPESDIGGLEVTTVNDEDVTIQNIIDNSQDYQIVYTQVTKNKDGLETYKRGNRDTDGKQWSYHVHLSIRKNPGDLTVTKTFAGLEADQIPDDFTMTVKSKNGTVVGTLTLENAEKTQNGVYTWTLENLNEDIYTVTEINTDVDNKALNVAYEVKDTSEETVESGNTTSAKVSVAGNETSSVAFTNTYTDAEGVLTITKVLENSQQATNGKPVFDFKITEIKEEGTVYYVHIDMSTNVHSKKLTLPAGTYKVEELDSLNYEIKSVTVNGGTKTPDAEGQITVEVGGSSGNVTVVYTNTADNSNIPSDSGATQNNPDWTQEGIVTWHKDDKITCNPEDPGKKPDSTEN